MNRSFSQFKTTREGGGGLYPGGLITGKDFLLPDRWTYKLVLRYIFFSLSVVSILTKQQQQQQQQQ